MPHHGRLKRMTRAAGRQSGRRTPAASLPFTRFERPTGA